MNRIIGLFVCLATLALCLPADAQVRSKAPGRINIGGGGNSGGSLLNRTNTLMRRSARPARPAPVMPAPAPRPGVVDLNGDGVVGGTQIIQNIGDRPLVVGPRGVGTLYAGRYYPYHSSYPFLSWYGSRYDRYDAYYTQPVPVIGYQYQVPIAGASAPGASLEPPAPPPTEMDLARAALRDGSVDEAIDRLRTYLEEHDSDAEAMRLLALALFDDRRMEEAVAMLALAYETEPSLASRSIDGSSLEGGEMELRRRVRRAVQYANKPGAGSSAWLMVMVLMQAENRDNVAGTMLERAEAVGLAEPVVEEFRSALR